MRTLRLLNLQRTTDDNTYTKPIKETFLTVENGIFHIFGPESMKNGKDWNLNSDIQFNKQAIISFFDEDLIRNLSTIKHFRNYIVKENEVHDSSKKMSFATNNANYILSYEII